MGSLYLFSVWETRVQDYRAFVEETTREWPKADFEQGPTHPAVMISWDDATTFCFWLTEHERKAGRLPPGELYRLPSDHEWNCAIGIGGKEDAARPPMRKEGQLPSLYVWGSQWPPPANLRIPEVPDEFKDSAPVGSFAADANGLHDLAGNVWEWCDGAKENVLRGGAYTDPMLGTLLASRRINRANSYGSTTTDFRSVLAAVSFPGPSASVPSAVSAAPQWHDALAESPLREVIAKADHNTRGWLLPAGNHWRATLSCGLARSACARLWKRGASSLCNLPSKTVSAFAARK